MQPAVAEVEICVTKNMAAVIAGVMSACPPRLGLPGRGLGTCALGAVRLAAASLLLQTEMV